MLDSCLSSFFLFLPSLSSFSRALSARCRGCRESADCKKVQKRDAVSFRSWPRCSRREFPLLSLTLEESEKKKEKMKSSLVVLQKKKRVEVEGAKKGRRIRLSLAVSTPLALALSLASLSPLPRAHGDRRAPIPRRNGKENRAQPFQKRPRLLCFPLPSNFFFSIAPIDFSSRPRPRPPLFPKKKEKKEPPTIWPTSPRSRAPRPRPTAAPSPSSSSSTPTDAAPSAGEGARRGPASTSASSSASTAPVKFFFFLPCLLLLLPVREKRSEAKERCSTWTSPLPSTHFKKKNP